LILFHSVIVASLMIYIGVCLSSSSSGGRLLRRLMRRPEGRRLQRRLLRRQSGGGATQATGTIQLAFGITPYRTGVNWQ
jgi:hypothetical protein